MNYLAFDTSGFYLTVAVKGKEKIVKKIDECTKSHSVLLMDEIESVLQEANTDLKDIDVFACSIGAGSFTGIRIGVATAKAFAYALSKKVLGVTTFESLAYDIVGNENKLTVIDARHDNFYVCGFNKDNEVILKPSFLTKDEVLSLSDYLIISDTDIEGINVKKADIARGFVKAVEAKIGNASSDVETLVPLYVKKSQAEEGL